MSAANPADRTVHGQTADGLQIVRYARAGKWYLEGGGSRCALKLAEAAALAAAGTWYPRRPGAQAFNARVDRIRRAS